MFHPLRVLLRRYPLAWWLAMVMTSSLTGLLVFGSLSRSHAAAERLDGMVSVQVSARAVPPGGVVTKADVASRPWPRLLLPQAELENRPVGKVAAGRIPAGTPLSRELFADSAIGGAASLLRPGERGVAIPRDESTPTLQVGDWVDLYASQPPAAAAPANLVGTNLRVIGVRDDAVMLSAPEGDVAPITSASGGRLVAVLSRPPSNPDGQFGEGDPP